MGWIEQLGEVDTDGVEPMRSVMPLPRALARRRGDRRRPAGRRSCTTRPVRTTATSSCPRWSNERAHRPHPRGGARRPARAQRSRRASWRRRTSRAIERQRALNAFITETPERALAMAGAADARLGAGEGGLLEGMPLAIKDLFCTEGVLTTAGSHILDGFVPPYESTVSRKLWAGGRGLPRQDQPRRVRHGLVQHDLLLRRRPQSLDPAGRERRPGARAAAPAARRRRSPRASAWAPPAPTPAARSASRPPSAASPASSRPTAAARAGASSPSRARSTRPARWRARSRTAR